MLLVYVYRASFVALWTALCSLVVMTAVPFAPQWALGPMARRWARGALRACGVRLRCQGVPPAPEDGPYVVMANHKSHFDVLALYASTPVALFAVAKKELGYVPIFGWALWAGAAVIIDRGRQEKAFASLRRAGALIRSGRTVLLFPEGTRRSEPGLGPFKKGPFHLAQAAGVPIVPVWVEGSSAVLPSGGVRIRSGVISVHWGDPIRANPEPGEPPEAHRERLMEAVAATMEKALVAGGNA